MPTELFRDQFSNLSRDDDHKATVLRWSSATKTMTDAQFREGLERLASFLEKESSPNVLIDVVEFAHQPAADFSAWRDKNIIPRYNAAGVRKFAFLLAPNAAHTVEHGAPPAIEEPGTFPTAYFNTRAAVDAWFAAKA